MVAARPRPAHWGTPHSHVMSLPTRPRAPVHVGPRMGALQHSADMQLQLSTFRRLQGSGAIGSAMRGGEGINSAFQRSFKGMMGVTPVAYKNLIGHRVSGQTVAVDIRVELSPASEKLLKRLPMAAPVVRNATKRSLRRAAQRTVLPVLRQEIPKSRGRKKWTVAPKGTLKGDRRRGRTHGYGKTKHIRGTVKAENPQVEAGKKTRVRVTVGSSDLWYGAALHARVPYFPRTLQKTRRRFEREVGRALDDVVKWVATGMRGGF